MKICIFLWAVLSVLSVLSAAMSAPTESDRLPQFLQALPFFSELQSLQQTFQDLQANIPAEVMSQLQQSLPPFLVNILAGGQQTATTRTLQDLQSQLPQLIQTLTQLQSSLPPEVLTQLQQSLPPFLASLLQQPAGRSLQEVAQQLQQSLPPFLANLLASQLSNGGSSQLLQQLQTVLPPEIFQQLQQIIANLQPATGRADETADTTKLTEDQKIQIEDFVKRCQSFASGSLGYGGYSGSGYRYPSSGYNSYYPSYYSTGTSYPYYNTGYNSGYPTPNIAIQPSFQRYPGSTGTLYGTNGGYIASGRSDLERKDNDDIETKHKHGGGGKYGWKNPFNNYYGNYQKPNYGNYQKPTYGNFQNPNFNPYMYYNPYNAYQYQYPNYNIGTIGNNGVIVPATSGTGANTGTVTAIREQPE